MPKRRHGEGVNNVDSDCGVFACDIKVAQMKIVISTALAEQITAAIHHSDANLSFQFQRRVLEAKDVTDGARGSTLQREVTISDEMITAIEIALESVAATFRAGTTINGGPPSYLLSEWRRTVTKRTELNK